jgi:hypothetical protein
MRKNGEATNGENGITIVKFCPYEIEPGGVRNGR